MVTLTVLIPDEHVQTVIDEVNRNGGNMLSISEDDTDYLNSSEANAKRLQNAIDEMESGVHHQNIIIED